MDIIANLFTGSGIPSTILYLTLAGAFGVLLGKIEAYKVRLGISGVLFVGLALAHFGAKPDLEILHFVREFGLILFVYGIGIDVGPRFVNSFKKEGLKLNLLAISIVLIGFGITVALYLSSKTSATTLVGIMSGAVTNTPGLGAAQQIITEQSAKLGEDASMAGISYAVAYPIGVIGVILSMILIRAFFRIKVDKEVDAYKDYLNQSTDKLESVTIRVQNPNLAGMTWNTLVKMFDKELAISRIYRDGDFISTSGDFSLQTGDIIYGVAPYSTHDSLSMQIGPMNISEKKDVEGRLGLANILITVPKVAGKTIEEIGIYRRYEANITRIFRADMEILPTLDTVIERGDTVRVVGKKNLLPDIKKELGNSVHELARPNSMPIFLGIALGVILGSLPIFIPGLPAPAKLGMAGGPLIIAILLGHKGRIGKMDFYMTPGANHLIRELGIVLFLACVGLSSGSQFVETIVHGGYRWIGWGAIITIVPVLIVGVIARMMKVNYLKICGLAAGAMTDPPALEFANSIAPIQAQSTAYASVYPLTMFLRVLLAQLFILVAAGAA